MKGYDYSQAGMYFITICVQNRDCLFGKIVDDQMILNDAGKMVESEWLKLPERFKNIELHKYVVMPNHFHAILEIAVGATLVVAQNEMVAQNNDVDRNNVDTTVMATLVVAQNEMVSQNNDVDRNNVDTPVMATLVVAQNEMVAQNENTIHSDKGMRRPQGHAPTVGDMMDAFKSITTVEYIDGVKTLGWPRFNRKLWQRNYWDHLIRDQKSYDTISQYIINNPKNWNTDKLK